MFQNKKIVVVMPAYNAAKTLEKTYEEVMAQGIVDRVILVDDASGDDTAEVARGLGNVRVHVHPENGAMAETRSPATASRWRRTPTSSS